MEWNIIAGRPIWQQLKEHIAMGIVTGAFPPGSKLPSVRELSVDAGVNPNTMQRALTELERDGLARSMGTIGREVTEDREIINALRKEIAQDRIQQYLNGMQQLGFTPQEAVKVLEETINE